MGRLLLALLLATRLVALDGPVVELAAEPLTAEPGAEVTVRITYRWPSGWAVRDADPALAFADEPATGYPPPESGRTAREEHRAWTVVLLAPTTPGPWELPRPALTAVGPEGPRTATAPSVVVQIGPDPGLPATAPPRPLVAGDGSAIAWWARLAGIAAAVAIAAGAGWWWLGRPARPAPTPIELFRREIAAEGTGKAGAAAVALALRRYLGGVHGFDGVSATGAEAAERVRGQLPEHEHATLAALLSDLDDRRWAEPELPPGALDRAREAARAWVESAEARAAIVRAAKGRG